MLINGVEYGRAKVGTAYTRGKKQTRFVAGNGVVRVRDKSVEEQLITYMLPRLTKAQKDQLEQFLTGTVNYAEETFVIVDDWGESRTVRLWDSKIKTKEKMGRFFSVSFTVRIEN